MPEPVEALMLTLMEWVLLGDGLGEGAARLIHGSAAVRSPRW